jgi:hypothetical protein
MGPVVQFDVQGECAMACYFLMAHWGGIGDLRLDTVTKPMRLMITLEGPGDVDQLLQVLSKAESLGGSLATSAIALKEIAHRKTAGLVLPPPTEKRVAGRAG